MKSLSRRDVLQALAISLFAAKGRLSFAQTTPSLPTQPPPLGGVAHIAIRVADIPASVAFYNKLGYVQAFAMNKGDAITQSFLKVNDRQFIELYPVNPQNPTQDKPGFLHLCFEGVDLNAIHDYYVAEGLTPIAVRKAGAGNLLFTLKGPMQYADPQNIEYTQYMPGSMHTNDFGQHLGPDRIADRMTVVTLAMQDVPAAKAFYNDKLGFVPVSGGGRDAFRYGLPGTSGQAVEIVPIETLEARSSITLETTSLAKAEAHLKQQGVMYKKTATGLAIADPDGNLIQVVGRP